MKKYLCIHGHFYQPPREDPWLGKILPEGSAAPFTHWNERITRESYRPMAFARRLDGQGRIVEILNCYEWMSFNAGPTLLSWMARATPDAHAAIVAADAASARRLGHGNAIAQVYHHIIMPLATARDKELEVAWAVADFEARFSRKPEGMWLSEAAVDTPTLEVLARHNIAFTILSPHQAKSVAGEDGQWRPAGGNLNILEPYKVELPSGRSIAVFFYDGPLSQAVAFERLLSDGEQFFRRLSGAAGDGLLCLATDGETYGHHFKFGEMALAYALDQVRSGRDGLAVTNFAAYLAAHPPRRKATLIEPSAWSCAHGVERWRSDCGCTDGGHPGWQQRWRAPLREALANLKAGLDAHFDKFSPALFTDPEGALIHYGRVLAGLADEESFQGAWFVKGIDKSAKQTAWKLLSMQQWALASFASCAWFFDEISRLEPVNGLTFALRAMELARQTGAADFAPRLEQILAMAPSNVAEFGNGKRIWREMVMPRLETPSSLAGQAVLTLSAARRFPMPGESATATWPGVSVAVTRTKDNGAAKAVKAKAEVSIRHESGSEVVNVGFGANGADGLLDTPVKTSATGGENVFYGRDLPWNKRQSVADAFVTAADDSLFALASELAATGMALIPEEQEAQTTLTLAPRWAGLWPALAWAYVAGARLAPKKAALLTAYLRREAAGNPAASALLGRLVADMTARLAGKNPDFAAVAAMIERAREVNLAPELWELQNALWAMRPLPEAARPLAEAVGFAWPLP